MSDSSSLVLSELSSEFSDSLVEAPAPVRASAPVSRSAVTQPFPPRRASSNGRAQFQQQQQQEEDEADSYMDSVSELSASILEENWFSSETDCVQV